MAMKEKKPHTLPPGLIEKVSRHFDQIEADERRRIARLGRVRPVIDVVAFGKRLVAVGSGIFSIEEWKTFPEFLTEYMLYVFGSGWLENERAKPAHESHPVFKWIEQIDSMALLEQADDKGRRSIARDGVVSALLFLAYDLYVLNDHRKLQKEVMERVRKRPEFRGARYELLVAATFIRAGFDFKFEDETDEKRKHPEFIATHRASGTTMAVEAKARQRARIRSGVTNAGVYDLLVSAARKRADIPYAVFVEVDMPPSFGKKPTWLEEVDETAKLVASQYGNPFDVVFFMNIPHHYGAKGKPDPAHDCVVWRPVRSDVEMPSVESIWNAIGQYGNIPEEFTNKSNP